jgi:hypothetical protein
VVNLVRAEREHGAIESQAVWVAAATFPPCSQAYLDDISTILFGIWCGTTSKQAGNGVAKF